MKRVLVVCVLCILVVPMAPAQSTSIGAQIGGGLSFLGGSDWRDALDWLGGNNKTRSGFTVGAFFNFPIGPGFCIQPGIAYSRMGGAYSYYYYDPWDSFKVSGTVTASALEVPVLLMGQFAAGKGKIRLFAGPDLILILGDIEVEEKGGGYTAGGFVEPDNRVVFGIKGGIGGAYPLGPGDIVADLSYTRSLTNMHENDNTAINGLLFTAGYQIGL